MSAVKLSPAEVTFHPLSYADANGRLFWWQGGLYRAITDKRAVLYRQLFDRGVVQKLNDKGLLVETELTSLLLDGYAMVLRHREVPFVSYCYEWCAAMLKEAALTVMDVELELAREHLNLQDAHPWNVLFDGVRPVYVDFGSVEPSQSDDSSWPAHDEFCRFFIYPLYLMAHGHGRIARWLLHDYEGVLQSEFNALIHRRFGRVRSSQGVANRLRSVAKRCAPLALRPAIKNLISVTRQSLWSPLRSARSRIEFLEEVRREVESIDVTSVRTSLSESSLGPSVSVVPEDDSVRAILSDLRPRTVLSVGGHAEWSFPLLASLGSTIVACDVDEACSTRLFHKARKKSLPILPLLLDLRNPSAGYGVRNREMAPATRRLRCEMVMALDVIHRLVFEQHLNFDQIVAALSDFSGKRLLVEFVSDEDHFSREWWSGNHSWYTLENFQEALKRLYREVTVVGSGRKRRTVMLCQV